MFKVFQKQSKQNNPSTNTDMVEYCVICGKKTEYTRQIPIDKQIGYVEGVGKLCRKCCMDTYQIRKN